MPHETGGRSDKFGNRYESRWVVKQLLRLINEEISSVTVEAIGSIEEGVDLWVKKLDKSWECHQCKSRNASKEYWNLSDLNTRGIFVKVKKQLEFNSNVSYHFVSAVAGMMLHDITNRARNSNGNPEHFYNFQVKGSKEVEKAFKQFSDYMLLDIGAKQDRAIAYEYLKRIYVVQYPDDYNEKQNLNATINNLYKGDSEQIYSLLANYPIEDDLLGREITSIMLNNYLTVHGVTNRLLYKDERIIPNIERLNSEFALSFTPINDSIIHRNESERCYEIISTGSSIIIHGKAGSGKSGCVLELFERLKEDNIIHLAVKLDRRIPNNNSEKYGEDLGFPASPVFCLNAVSNTNRAVLILDQLDAIRWTNNHSQTAWEVCKQMIREVASANEDRTEKIAIIFVCRTFDYENDGLIKSLFSKEASGDSNIHWESVCIGELDEENVKSIVGDVYKNLNKRLQTLLRTPNNLYIWKNLDESGRKSTFTSSSDLIKQWWRQITNEGEISGIAYSEINELKNFIVSILERNGKLMLPQQLLGSYSPKALDKLVSCGLLSPIGEKICFVHQSFFDYFLAEKMFIQINEGSSIIDVIGHKSKQNLSKRYQLQMLFENLLNCDIDNYICIGRDLLQSEEIRFHLKYLFLEVLGQAAEITPNVEMFVLEFLNKDNWKYHLLNAVIMGHTPFVEFLINVGLIDEWLNREQECNISLNLLRSVSDKIPDLLTSLLHMFAFKDLVMDRKIFNTLCWNIDENSDNMFSFRVEILKVRPEIWDDYYINWGKLLDINPDRALQLLNIIIRDIEQLGKHVHSFDQKVIDKFVEAAGEKPHDIWNTYMPCLADITSIITSIYDYDSLHFWNCQYGHISEQTFGRTYVNMIKAAAKTLIQQDAEEFLALCEQYYDNSSIVVNEVLLYIMRMLPNEYSDDSISWLIERPRKRFFDYTGENDDYLASAKMVIAKHSKTCSDEIFRKLENTIYYFHEEDELQTAKHRFNTNRENRKSGEKWLAYWPYWGIVQHRLLGDLDSRRVSKATKELTAVLSRHPYYFLSRHKRSRVEGGVIGSTIGANAGKISDKQWLRIIGNKKLSTDSYRKQLRRRETFLESSPIQFSNTLERIGAENPNRIVKLALMFPNGVDSHYVSAVYQVIGLKEPKKTDEENGAWEPVGTDVAEQVFKKFSYIADQRAVMSFLNALRDRADEDWSDDVINLLVNIAKTHEDPNKDRAFGWSSNDPEGKTAHSLDSNSINCVRGCAAETIAELLWEKKGLYNKLEGAIESLVHDEHLAVNMAAISCVCPAMNISREKAIGWFFQLVEKDIRIAASRYSYHLLYNIFEKNPTPIKKLVAKMCESDIDDVSETGARHISNMYILFGCFDDTIFAYPNKTTQQKKAMLDVALGLLKDTNLHDRCKNIIEFFLEDDADLNFYQLFNNENIHVDDDFELIIKALSRKAGGSLMRKFVDFIEENDFAIRKFKDIIFAACKNAIINTKEDENLSQRYGIASELSKFLAQLYDETSGDADINQQCLDLWDLMYENNIGTVRELSRSIMDL